MEGYRLLRGRVTGGFWGKIQKRIAKETLDQQYDILNGKRVGLRPDQYSFCIENFELAAGRKSGEYHGYVYSDSELDGSGGIQSAEYAGSKAGRADGWTGGSGR